MTYLDKDTLRVGDEVGVPHLVQLGWQTFRYPNVIHRVIKRITPARKKFVMEDGHEYNHHTAFCAITEDTTHQSEVARCAINIHHRLFKLDQLQRKNLIFTKNDETLIKVSTILNELMEVLDGKDAD